MDIDLNRLIEESKIGERLSLQEMLKEESDRGCALLAVSYLENELKDAIKAKLVDDKQACKYIFDTTLSTFNSKINIAYLLGIISSKQKENIITLKHIRNKFAHSYKKIEFNTQAIVELCDKLKYKYEEYISDATVRDKFILNVDKEIQLIIKAKRQIEKLKKKEIDDITSSNSILKFEDRETFDIFLEEIFGGIYDIALDEKIKELLYQYYVEKNS